MISSYIFYLVALGLAALGLRYLLAREPLDYHAEILRRNDPTISEHTTYVIRTMYKIIGSFMCGSAIMVAGTTAFWMSSDPKRVAFLIGLFGLFAGGYVSLKAYQMSQDYGVNAPWKPGVVLTGASVTAAVYVLLLG